MLKLTRRTAESIIIETSDGTIEVTICEINGGQVRVGVDAEDSVGIWRKELYKQKIGVSQNDSVDILSKKLAKKTAA